MGLGCHNYGRWAEVVGHIRLANGDSWTVIAGDGRTVSLVAHLAKVMQFRPIQNPGRRLVVLQKPVHVVESTGDDGNSASQYSCECGDTFVYTLPEAGSETTFASQLSQVSLVISQNAQARGGVLLHGALAEWNGNGIILAGRSGIGKTTASQRLEPPWHSLSDDLTLVVPDAEGTYWAHPWPTWSQFIPDGPGGSWNVPHAVPLKRIFFLTQASQDQADPIGSGQAVCQLVESWEQARLGMLRNGDKNARRTRCLQGFENICTLAQTIPCYNLCLSLTGPFWQEIEKTMRPHTNPL